MLKASKRDLESQILSTEDGGSRTTGSYRKRFIFFRSRLCNFMRQNRVIVVLAIFILFLLLYFLNQPTEHNSNNSAASGLHLYVQNPIFWKDVISSKRKHDNTERVQGKQASSSSLTDLIIVAGHAVYSHYSYRECTDPANWRLFEHQRKENHLSAFLQHIQVGVDLTYSNPKAMLIFSGGSTRTEVGPFSEGSTYWKVAENCDYDGFAHFKDIEHRAFTEDYAMDSFQNILFSICRFYEITGNYPSSITAISWSYKKTRFEKLHRRALDYPQEQFVFRGVDGDVNLTENAWNFEKMAIELYKQDLFGCYLKLKETRIERNPYFRSLPYPHQCPHLKQLFNICADSQGLESLQLKLPWNS